MALAAASGLVLAAGGCGDGSALEEWTLETTETLRLGEDPASPGTAFYLPTDIAVDGSGRLYVLDSGNHRVEVFQDDGLHLATLGREGDGPGEMSRPEGIWAYPNGEILVADTGNRRLHRFGPARDLIATTALDLLPLDVVGVEDRIYVLRLPTPTMMFGADDGALVAVFDRDGRPVAEYVRPEAHDVGALYFLRNTLRIAPGPGSGFAIAESHVLSRIREFDRHGNALSEIPVLYKPGAFAPLGRLPRVVNDHSVDRIARTTTHLTWDPIRRLYWVVAGYVDQDTDGVWVVGTELYRYDRTGVYRGSVMLPFSAIALAASPDRSLWVLDREGIVHRLTLRDPDLALPQP